jgi:thiol-disulfide isomerase/thioredoxin
MKAYSFTQIATAAAVAVAFVVPAGAAAQAQYQGNYNQAYYAQYQQYYQTQQAQQPRSRFGSLFGNKQVQQVQQPRSWYQQQAQPAASSRQVNSSARQRNARSAEAAKSVASRNEQPRQAARRTSQENNGQWLTSFDSAWSKAYQQGRPLVVLFVHHGCPVCDQMDQNLAQPGAMDTLANAVKVRVEFTDNPAVVNRFGVKLTPTFLVLTPQGAEAYREVGALSVDRLRQIQPAIDSLVAAPPASSSREKTVSSSDTSNAPVADEGTSQTVASL